jgi:hypothetical protein
MADRDVTPDDSLLGQIFTTNLPETISIFLQNWDKCVFKAEFPRDGEHHHSTCVVRLEAENKNLKTFTTIASMQQMRMFHFSVIELVEGDLLEDMWQQMSAKEQSSVVAELVKALEKLHSVRLSDKWVKEILGKMLPEESDGIKKSFEQSGAFGGPHTGFLNGGPALLDSIMARRRLNKPFFTIEPIVGSQDVGI